MRRILVPLDSSDLSTSILDDALRLAGPDGTLILLYEAKRTMGRAASAYVPELDLGPGKQHLEGLAEGLRSRGASVITLARSTFDVSAAIDEVAGVSDVDMIACATHSRGVIGTLLRGSVAWKVLSQSPVPVLLRHPITHSDWPAGKPEQRRILVPLDGSNLAEKALPLAQELATEWQAPIDLLLVMPEAHSDLSLLAPENYLECIGGTLGGKVKWHILSGNPVDIAAAFVYGAGITDIVMTSHGRTGLSRVFLGSVAYEIIRRVPLPVIVVPALFVRETAQHDDGVWHETATVPTP
jgi:nucleotide-binding universal stress UspA family protein